MSSDDDMRPIPVSRRDTAAEDRRRRLGKSAKRQRDRDRDILRSPSYLALRVAQAADRRSPSPARRRARTRRHIDRRRARSNTYSDDDDESDRRSRSRSPRRRRRARSDSYSDDDEKEIDYSRSPSPRRRRRARSNTYTDEESDPDRRSRSPRRRAAPRSCRNQSRSRSEECEDRRCCPPRPAADDERDMAPDGERDMAPDDERDMAPDEDDFYVRIDRSDHLFKCARCHHLLPPPVVYECVDGHVTCATCHVAANRDVGEGDGRCSQCGSSNYGPSRAVADWLRSVRFLCRYYDYGCSSYLPRHAMESGSGAHERTCRHAPVFCPVCDEFCGGPTDSLERHLAERHGWSIEAFRYGEPITVRVRPEEARSVLRATEDGELFHLRAVPQRGGTTLSMICIRPDTAAAAEFEYEVRTHAAAGMKHRLQMQSTVWATSLEDGVADANPVSVTVPDDMLPVDGPEKDSVEVRVRKVVVASAAARED
ncbi:unnamed protein product [Urochloa humidicola]